MESASVWAVCEHLGKKAADTSPQTKDLQQDTPKLDQCIYEGRYSIQHS